MVMAKANKTLSDMIRDSLELSRWLTSKGFEKYIPIFLDQELFLYLLQGNFAFLKILIPSRFRARSSYLRGS